MKPSDFIKAINKKTNRDLIRGSDNPDLMAKEYIPWQINRGLSFYVDCIILANDMNMRPHLTNIMQNDYFINTIRPNNRFSTWHKKEKDSVDMLAVMEYYNVGHNKAQEFLKVLTKKQIDLIKIRIIKGGNIDGAEPKSIDRGHTI
jgi:hypothetical protein